MKTFNFKAVYSQLLTPEIVFRLTQLHEYKGRLNRLLETDAAALSEIKETAALQTVAASNRMEGITVAEDRLKKLILNKTNPQTDDEKKVAGYRDVLTSISANYDFLPPAPSTILQLHRDLYKFSGKAVGGNYKDTDGEPCAESLASLCNAFEQALQDPVLDPLLLIPMFMVDFLNIAPFDNGTERMSRLLLTLLLYRSGYEVEQYSSIDAILLNTKASYDAALQRSSTDTSGASEIHQRTHQGKFLECLFLHRYPWGDIVSAYIAGAGVSVHTALVRTTGNFRAVGHLWQVNRILLPTDKAARPGRHPSPGWLRTYG